MTLIDHKKYSNMSKKQLENSLSNAEKKEQKIKVEMEQKLSETKELIKFLRSIIKKDLGEPEYYTLETSPAMKKIRKDFENLPKEQQQELEKELEIKLSHGNNNALQG